MASPGTPTQTPTDGGEAIGPSDEAVAVTDGEKKEQTTPKSAAAAAEDSPVSVRALIAARESRSSVCDSPGTSRATPKKSQSFSCRGPPSGSSWRRTSTSSDGPSTPSPALAEEPAANGTPPPPPRAIANGHAAHPGKGGAWSGSATDLRQHTRSRDAAVGRTDAIADPKQSPTTRSREGGAAYLDEVFAANSPAQRRRTPEVAPAIGGLNGDAGESVVQRQTELADELDGDLARMASFRIRPRRVGIVPTSPALQEVTAGDDESEGRGKEQLLVSNVEVPKQVTQMFFKELFAGGKRKMKDEDCIGFATLPDQVHRKAVKRGFHFTIMVIGESGLGKSTLINSLFSTDLYPYRRPVGVEEKISRTIEMTKNYLDIEEKNVKLRMTIIDTPGFGDSILGQQSYKPVEEYIDEQCLRYLQDESGLNRRNISDNRVHCLLYFLSPSGHGLKPLDIEVMKRLHHKVNIIPIIAKADTLTSQETMRLKREIIDDLDKYGINTYDFPECDSDEDDEFKLADAELKAAIPFAVIGSNVVLEVNGQRVRGRLYPWGIVEVENPQHSDFMKLRRMLISTHLQDLKDVTEEVHYENFRAEHIQRMEANNNVVTKANLLSDETRAKFAVFEQIQQLDLEKQLLEKEMELKRTQELLMQMQSQLVRTQQQV